MRDIFAGRHGALRRQMSTIMGLVLPGNAAGVSFWKRAGFKVSGDNLVTLNNFTIGQSAAAALSETGLEMTATKSGSLDGIPLIAGEASTPNSAVSMLDAHPNKAARCYALIVRTPSWRRTEAAILAETGLEPAAVRTDIYPGLRLSFFKLLGAGGHLELIAPAEEHADAAKRDRPAAVWGLTFEVGASLDHLGPLLGEDAVGAPRKAVQPGRVFAALRGHGFAAVKDDEGQPATPAPALAVGFISTAPSASARRF